MFNKNEKVQQEIKSLQNEIKLLQQLILALYPPYCWSDNEKKAK